MQDRKLATVEREVATARQDQLLGDYRYPLTPSAHSIGLLFRDYSYQGSEGIRSGFLNTSERVSGSVILPIPTNLQDSYSVTIQGTELGIFGAAAADITSGNASGIGEDVDAFMGTFETARLGAQVLSVASQYAAFAARQGLDSIAPGAAAGVAVGTGTALNPHLALQFKGVELKSHSFQWTLSPRNAQEAEMIKDMIAFIRRKVLPRYTDGATTGGGSSSVSRALLTYPSLIDVSFFGVDEPYFYYFKPCMCNNFTVNYAPTGNVSLNRGGRPSMVTLAMSLTEARIRTADDEIPT